MSALPKRNSGFGVFSVVMRGLVVLALSLSSIVFAQDPAVRATGLTQFLREVSPLESHSKYIAIHYKKGTVLMAGPLANADPSVDLDMLVPEVKEIRLADWSKMVRSGGYAFLESPQSLVRRG